MSLRATSISRFERSATAPPASTTWPSTSQVRAPPAGRQLSRSLSGPAAPAIAEGRFPKPDPLEPALPQQGALRDADAAGLLRDRELGAFRRVHAVLHQGGREDLIEKFGIPLDEYPKRCIEQIARWKDEAAAYRKADTIEVKAAMNMPRPIVNSVWTGEPSVIYGNVRNNGCITSLPAGCAAEVPCLVDAQRASSRPIIGALPPQLTALIRTNINVQELTVRRLMTEKPRAHLPRRDDGPAHGGRTRPRQIWMQDDAMRALYLAANKSTLIVQISAHTDGAGADLPFLVTKRAADEALAKAGLPFVILRPAIVIGRNAYGGSALLRALAAIPYCSPLSSPSSPMRFIALTDLIGAVSDAIEGVIAPGSDIELAGPGTFSLAEAVARHRQWLGLGPVRPLTIPQGLARLVGRAADGLGRLGWRSPLRSTALIVAKGGIANPLATQSGRSLDAALNANPAGIADLWFARLYLLKPIVIGVLSFFWLASGAIALLRFDASVAQLAAGGFGPTIASATTLLTSCADLALGALVLVRRHSAVALKGMLILSLAYLGAATILTPSLWLDLLGPLVKVLPASVLALVALAILDER
jgi:hypothetical protein